VRNHEPPGALFGGASGLDVYRRLLPEVSGRLANGGWLLLEVGAGQALPVGQLVENAGLRLQMVLKDLQGIPRCVVARNISRET
jgi:release factor glutamine methyltransferase